MMVNYLSYLVYFIVFLLLYRSSKQHFNRCDMTFMYRYPKFMEIPMGKPVEQSFPHYGLILYGEGDYAEQSKSLKLTGNPVLFIPGNAGSSKQVRSLGSIMQMKSESGSPNSLGMFNVFAIDYDEELCGLYGGYFVRQTLFVAEAIKRIFSLYDHLPVAERPKQIVLVGHSMGGVVARAVLTLRSFDRKSVAVLLTLASPHIAAPVRFDTELTHFLVAVNEYWASNANSSLAHLTIASIAGGSHDLLVPSYLTKWPAAFNDPHPDAMRLIQQTSANVDLVWAEADHLCIVWCNQLIRVIARALFDMLDRDTQMLSSSPSSRYETIKWHFEQNRGAKSVYEASSQIDSTTGLVHFGTVERSVNFTSDSLQTFSTNTKRKDLALCKLFVDESLVNQSVFLLTTQDISHFVHECVEEACESGFPLDHHRLLPPLSRYLHLKLTDHWLGRTLVVPSLHHSSKRFLVYKRYSDDDPTHSSEMQFSLLDPFKPWPVINEDISGTVAFRNVTLKGFTSIAQVYIVRLVPVTCKQKSYANISAVRLSVLNDPAFSLVRHFRFPYDAVDDMVMYLQSPTADEFPVLQLFLDPACQYQLTIQPTLSGSLFEVIRQLSFVLPSIISFHVLALCFICELNNIFFHSSSPWFVARWQLLLVIFQYFTMSLSNTRGSGTLSSALIVFIAVSLVNSALLCSAIVRWALDFIARKSTSISARMWPYFPSVGRSSWAKTVGVGVSVLTACGVNGIIVIIVFFVIRLLRRERNDVIPGKSLANVESLLIVIHLLSWLFVGPSGIIWVKNLIKHGMLSLSYDPSFFASAAFLIAFSLPVPPAMAPIRPFILPVAATYICYTDYLLSTISASLAAVAGCYMNSAFAVVVGIETKKDKTA
uniref:GPI inositol-deacylase n=1 Tax=Plectus sambesii TaxID=2011161 RepID=A0A914W163_9BILA